MVLPLSLIVGRLADCERFLLEHKKSPFPGGFNLDGELWVFLVRIRFAAATLIAPGGRGYGMWLPVAVSMVFS
jgi:hypothetical protein